MNGTMDDEKIIDPRYLEELRKYSAGIRKGDDDAMALAMAGQAVFHPDSPFVSIEARSHVNKEKSAEEKLGEAIESEIIAFGGKHGFPVIYVITEQDVLPMTVIGGNVVCGGKLNLFMISEMRKAERIAKKYNGTIGICKDSAEYYRKEFEQAPVIDNELPSFCKARHCSKRSKACAKCAYTAMSSSERRKLEA
jgi:hypothetical protein